MVSFSVINRYTDQEHGWPIIKHKNLFLEHRHHPVSPCNRRYKAFSVLLHPPQHPRAKSTSKSKMHTPPRSSGLEIFAQSGETTPLTILTFLSTSTPAGISLQSPQRCLSARERSPGGQMVHLVDHPPSFAPSLIYEI